MKFLYVFFSMLLIVRRNMLGLFDAAHGFRARVPDRDSAFLGELMDDFDELFAALFGQRRERNANDVAVVRRRESQVGREDALLDRLEQPFVPRLDSEQLRLGRGHARDRRHRHLSEQRGRRLAGAHGREVALHRFDRLVHQLFRVLDVIGEGHWTIVPTRSPARTLAVAPGWLMLNTTMGSLFSLHNPKAFASMTA